MDVLAVKNATAYAKAYALENGPIILEMDTYRYHGHSMSDPGSTYRTRDEINAMRTERDPVERVKKLLLTNGVDPAEIKKIDKEVKKQVGALPWGVFGGAGVKAKDGKGVFGVGAAVGGHQHACIISFGVYRGARRCVVLCRHTPCLPAMVGPQHASTRLFPLASAAAARSGASGRRRRRVCQERHAAAAELAVQEHLQGL